MTGGVDGGDAVGGLAGSVLQGSTKFCYAAGRVHGTESVGGLIGTSSGRFTLSNSLALNPGISGTSRVGVFTGFKAPNAKIAVENCLFCKEVQVIFSASTRHGETSVCAAKIWNRFPDDAWSGFDPAVWTANSCNANYCLPVLKWQGSLPFVDAGHLKTE